MDLKLNFTKVAAAGLLLGALPMKAAPHINGIAGLQRLEVQVKTVAAKATEATVSLISEQTGGAGSGVIVSEKGLILTAAHVTDGSREVTVVFPDGRQARGSVLGANYSRDAAMVQLQGEGPWPFVEMGDSESMKVGDFVVAMGHPKGYDPTRRPPVRFGRVMTRGTNGFITTDCTLTGGDSGGPLFDMTGRLVAIHSHIAPEKAVNNHAEVAGFKRSWDKMLAGKNWGILGADRIQDPDRPVLGVVIAQEAGGALVIDQAPENSPADRAGLQVGDLIHSIEGVAVEDAVHIQQLLIDYQPGDPVKVKVKRGEDEVEASLKLGAARQIFRRYRR